MTGLTARAWVGKSGVDVLNAGGGYVVLGVVRCWCVVVITATYMDDV